MFLDFNRKRMILFIYLFIIYACYKFFILNTYEIDLLKKKKRKKEIDETTGINKLVQRKIPQQTICDGKIVYRMINLIN